MSLLRTTTRRRHTLTPGINLTPMLDAIFNLVFFFLLATTLRKDEFQTEISLPESDTAVQSAGADKSITLDADGKIYFGGRAMVAEELELELTNLARGGRTSIAIRCDSELDFGLAYSVMDICVRSGIEVSLMAARAPDANQP